jgi:hypothetical protein
MANIIFELEKLRLTLRNKGLDARAVESIVKKAGDEISSAFQEQAEAAMQLAIESGVQQRSADFINELTLDSVNMELTTESGNMEFTEPPFPMLPRLLQNAKPMKDGSGVYKVIPVGTPGKDRPKVSTSIYDSWKQINAERIENARKQYQALAPKESKFRTATSKQDANTQWVKPAQTKDFSQDVSSINAELAKTMEGIVRDIVRSYEEGF